MGQRLYRHQGRKDGCPERTIAAELVEDQAIATLMRLADTELMADVRTEVARIAREALADDETGQAIITELTKQRDQLTKLEDLYLGGDIDKERYRQRKAPIDQTIANLENQLDMLSQMADINAVIRRIESAMEQLPSSSDETKKAIINSLLDRIEIGGGQILHIEPRPRARGFF